MTNQLAKVEREQSVAVVDRQAPNVGMMLHAVIEKGVTAENVAAVGELVKLYERIEQKNAEREFAAAFVELQKNLPQIEGHRPVKTKTGELKFRYANFDDIDAIVRPICLHHGFTYAFREGAVENGRVTVIMTLQHSGGHSREVPYSVRIGAGPPGANESQADVSGHSYAQRGALESGLSLRVVGARDDASMEGDTKTPVTEEQAFELERRVSETESNVQAFLRFAGADSFAKIPASKYAELDAMLRRKESGR